MGAPDRARNGRPRAFLAQRLSVAAGARGGAGPISESASLRGRPARGRDDRRRHSGRRSEPWDSWVRGRLCRGAPRRDFRRRWRRSARGRSGFLRRRNSARPGSSTTSPCNAFWRLETKSMTVSHRGGGAPERIVRAIIGGRVQGVGFRAWTEAEAEALGFAAMCATEWLATLRPSSPALRRPSRRCPGACGAGRRRPGSTCRSDGGGRGRSRHSRRRATLPANRHDLSLCNDRAPTLPAGGTLAAWGGRRWISGAD